MKPQSALLATAWKKLIIAYLLSVVVGLLVGTLLVKLGHVRPERIYEASTQRLSYALPVLEKGVRGGIDMGVLLFFWNTAGALATISFIYSAALFDPGRVDRFPRRLRKVFCGRTPMKLLCYLPGCARFDAEPLRRLYVWVMVPLLGMVLLGIESGLQVSTAGFIFGSIYVTFVSLLPHGLVEIPTFALAGAVTYSANLLLRRQGRHPAPRAVFRAVDDHRRRLPVLGIALVVVGGLLLAGLIEAHITPHLM